MVCNIIRVCLVLISAHAHVRYLTASLMTTKLFSATARRGATFTSNAPETVRQPGYALGSYI